jgi:simple sugar transport system ATP-binding protein
MTAEKTRKLLLDCRAKGSAILLISEDLDELLALSDRIIVMYQGKIVHECGHLNASGYEIGLAMTGHQ